MFLFSPPAHVDDLDAAGRAKWHATMAGIVAFNRAFVALEIEKSGGNTPVERLAYVDPRHSEVPPAEPMGRTWGGFPRHVLEVLAGGDHVAAWKKAEAIGPRNGGDPEYAYADGTTVTQKARVLQDEYLEWHADGDEDGIKRVSLTCEGPEYWDTLAEHDPDLLHARYEELLHTKVPKKDLFFEQDVFEVVDGRRSARPRFKAGTYNKYNKWNTKRGAVHLTHEANTLSAEVNLASRATIARLDVNEEPIEDPTALACCTQYGDPNRDSDPNIGATANKAVRDGNLLTLTDPIGLYIAAFDTSGIKLRAEAELAPGTPQPSEWWEPVRGERMSADGVSRILRIEYTIPEGATMPAQGGGRRPLVLTDLTIDGDPVTLAGALAELVTMHLVVTAWPAGGAASQPALHCNSTCCVDRQGTYGNCKKGQEPEFPDIYASEKSSPLPTDDERDALFDRVFQATYDEALKEAVEALKEEPDAAAEQLGLLAVAPRSPVSHSDLDALLAQPSGPVVTGPSART